MSNQPFGPLKRFGVLGGTFDPVHVGHLSIAQQVLNALKLEQVILLPAAVSPHKQNLGVLTPAADRLALCRLATHNLHGLSASDFELQRGGVSYTIDTARTLRQLYPRPFQIYFLIGSDSLPELPQWREIKELLELIDFAIAERRETPLSEPLWLRLRSALGPEAEKKLRGGVVEVERVDVSSTFVRHLLKSGEKLPGYLRADVEEYIRKKGLYGTQKNE